MHLDSELVEELNLLMHILTNSSPEDFNFSANASPAMTAAAQRLFQKGLVSQKNGGRLTDAGNEAADHMVRLTNLMSSPLEPI